tara:strand:- start:2877 stop:3641 length:765 start_codon:yes stop_codon:yes gene_type:complete
MQDLKKYQESIKGFNTKDLIKWALKEFGYDKLLLASSLGAEDQVLTKMMLQENSRSRIFTLDTGRQFQENYDVMQASQEKYSFAYELCFPDPTEVQNLVKVKGPNLFRKSIEDRKACCEVRKMTPLRKKLTTADCWITGLRSGQSITRGDMQAIEWDENFGLYKINPLILWSEEDVWDLIKSESIPYNKLHDQGFPSIGCAPCTRAIEPGQDIRSGRWWWEMPDQKECGLHFVDGKMLRTKDLPIDHPEHHSNQ